MTQECQAHRVVGGDSVFAGHTAMIVSYQDSAEHCETVIAGVSKCRGSAAQPNNHNHQHVCFAAAGYEQGWQPDRPC